MIKIGKYKGYSIEYSEGTFFGKKKGETLTSSSEEGVKDTIDKIIEQKDKEAKKIKIEKENKAIIKNFNKYYALVNLADFDKFISTAKDYITEGTLKFNKGKLSLFNIDPATVCMVKRVIPFKGNANVNLNVNLSEIAQSLKSIKKVMNALKTKTEKIKITFGFKEGIFLSLSNDFGKINLPYLEMYEKEIKQPKLKFMGKVKMSKDLFNGYLSMCNLVAESATLCCENGKFSISAIEVTTDEKIISDYKSPQISGVTTKKSFKSKYSLEYLNKRFVSGKTITISFGNDFPLMIEDELGNWFILAPRMEND